MRNPCTMDSPTISGCSFRIGSAPETRCGHFRSLCQGFLRDPGACWKDGRQVQILLFASMLLCTLGSAVPVYGCIRPGKSSSRPVERNEPHRCAREARGLKGATLQEDKGCLLYTSDAADE